MMRLLSTNKGKHFFVALECGYPSNNTQQLVTVTMAIIIILITTTMAVLVANWYSMKSKKDKK